MSETDAVREDGFDEEPDEFDGEDRRCHTCGGEQIVEEDNWDEPNYGDFVTCWNCRGSGNAKDCWLW